MDYIYVPILEFQEAFVEIQTKLKNLIQSIKRHLEGKKIVIGNKYICHKVEGVTLIIKEE